jgi:DNA-binding IclR family transcriptional regulator
VHVIEFRASKLRIADQDNDLPLRATADLLRHLHASAAGKLLLSSEQEWRDALPSGRLARLTPRTVTDPDQIANTLDKVRSEGFAAQVDELELGLCCLAAPISLTEQRALAAVCLSGPSERFGSLLDHIEDAKKLALELAPLLY